MANKTKTIVFIDAGIDAPFQLAAGIAIEAEILFLSAAEGGVEQIAAALKTHSSVSEIHIVAHGAPGCLYLGNSELSLQTLQRDRAVLQTWFAHVQHPSLYLYGCHVAAGDAGAEFLAELAALTKANIAASPRLIGPADQGGDWRLNATVGAVPVRDLLTAEAIATYTGTLAVNDFPTNPLTSVLTPGTIANGNNTGFTHQAGEPIHDPSVSELLPAFQQSLNNSIWWQWVSNVTGLVNVNTTGSAIDTVLAVYTGTGVNNLSLVDRNDNAGPGVTTSSVTFNAVNGTRYYFAVDGVGNDVGAISITLDTPPTIIPNQTRTVSELAALNAPVGGPIALAIAEPVTWSIAGGNLDNDGDGTRAFAINAASGQITVADPGDLDFEAFGPFYTLDVTVEDANGFTDTETVLVQVTDAPEPPVILSLNSPTSANEGNSITLTGQFFDPDQGQTQTLTVVWGDGTTNTVITSDSLVDDGSGNKTFSLNHIYREDNGGLPFNINVTVSDGISAPDSETRAITINNVAPTITGDETRTLTLDEDTARTFSLAATDPSSSDQAALVWSFVSPSPNGGLLALSPADAGPNKLFTYTPALNFSGTDTFQVQVADPDGGTDTVTVNFNVTARPDAPTGLTLSPSVLTLNQGGTLSLSGSFADPDAGDTFTVTIDWGDGSEPTEIANGDIPFNAATNTYAFSTDHEYLQDGVANISVSVRDSFGSVTSAGTAVTVNNVLPTLTPGNTSISLDEGGSRSVTFTASDPGDTTFTWDLATAPANGTVTITGTGATRTFTYTPNNPNFNGTDEFLVRVDDDVALPGATTATVTVGVNPINDAPTNLQVTAPAFPATVDEGETFTLTGTFDDVDNSASLATDDTHTVTIDWGDGNTVTLENVSLTNGALPAGTGFTADHTYLDEGDGSYEVIITVTDADGEFVSLTRDITVNNVNPVITIGGVPDPGPRVITVAEDGSVTFDVSAIDQGPDLATSDTLTWSIFAAPANGQVTLAAPGTGGTQSFTYIPNPDFDGGGLTPEDTFTIRVSDGDGGTDDIVVNVDVTPQNDLPEILVNNFDLVENEPLIIDTSVIDATDPETLIDNLVFTITPTSTTTPANPAIVLTGGATGNTFTGAQLLSGTVTLTYTGETTPNFTIAVTDADGETTSAPANVTFDPVNDAPVFDPADVPFTITEGGNVLITATNISATDPDDNPLDLVFTVTDLVGGEFQVNGTASNTFTQRQISQNQVRFFHDRSENAPSYTITVSDGEDSATRTDTITAFTPVNDRPEILVNNFDLVENEPLIIDTSVLDAFDAETVIDNLTFSITPTSTTTPANPAIVLAGGTTGNTFTGAQLLSGTVTLTYTGETTPAFTVTVTDPAGGTTSAPANVTFEAVNDAPVFDPADVPFTITEGGNVLVTATNISATDGDDNPPDLVFTVSNLVGGEFRVNGTASTTFTQRQISQNQVRFFHNGSENAPSYIITVSDGEDSATRTDTITAFTPVNDRPQILVNNFDLVENEPLIIDTSVLDAFDAETVIDNLTFSITPTSTTTPANPALVLTGGTTGNTFTGTQLLSGTVTLTYTGETTPAFTVTVTDPAGGTTSAPANVTFDSVNDAPVFDPADVPFSITEGGNVLVTATNISATDGDDNPPDLVFTVSNVVGGEFRVNGTASTTFTQRQISQNQVRFFHNGSENAPSYTITVSDGDDTATRTDTITAFTSVNDRPQILVNNFDLVENEPLIIDTSVLDVFDAETVIDNLTFSITPTSTTSPANPALVLAGGTSGNTFTGAQLLSGAVTLTYTGETTPAFTIAVTDPAGGTTSAPANVTFEAVNNAPVFDPADTPFSITEGGNVLVTATNISATDGDDNPLDLQFTVSNLIGGEFRVNGTASNTFTQRQISQNQVRFFHNGSENAPSYTITVSDGDDTATRTDTITAFTPVNDRPEILVNNFAIVENEPLVIDTSVLDVFDAETIVDNLTFTISPTSTTTPANPALVLAGGTTGSTFTGTQLLSGAVTLTYTGEATPAFTITVTDAGGGTTSAPANVTFDPVNDAPVFDPADVPFSITEGGNVLVSAANISATDGDDNPLDLQFTVSTVVGGEFRVNGTANNTFTQRQINQNQVRFFHDGSENAPSYTVTVSDGDDTAIRNDVITAFTPLNDRPQVQVNNFALVENQPLTIDTTVLNAIDPETALADLTFTITPTSTTTPANPALILTGGTSGNTFTGAQLQAGAVTLTYTGETTPSFSITVADNNAPTAGTTTVSANVTLEVVNDPPVLVDVNTTFPAVNEGAVIPLTGGPGNIFQATDEESTPAQLVYTIDSVTNGEFRLNGTATTTFTQQDILDGEVQFVHDEDDETDGPSFTFTLSDSGDPTAQTITQTVTPTFNPSNDAPVLGNNQLTITEGQRVVLRTANLSATDAETNSLELQFEVTNITNGTLTANGVDFSGLGATALFTLRDVIEGRVSFTHDATTNQPPAYNVRVIDNGDAGDGVPDPGDTASDPAPLDPAEPVTVSFTSFNDAPSLIGPNNPAFVVPEGGSLILGPGDITATDEDNPPATALQFTVSNVVGGFFARLNAPDTAVTQFTQADINNGQILFVHDDSNITDPLNLAVTYTLTVSDTNPDDPKTATATYAAQVTPVNDVPVITVNQLTIAEGETVVLGVENLLADDEESGPAELQFTIDSVSQNGQFIRDPAGAATPITVGQTFTLQEILDGNIAFQHFGTTNPPTLTSALVNSPPAYTLTVTDAPVAGDPAETSQPSPATITFTADNDAPVLINNLPFAITQGQSAPINTGLLEVRDEETTNPALVVYTVNSVSNGRFLRNGLAVTSFSQEDINAGRIEFEHSGSENPPNYSLTVTDGGTPTAETITVTSPDFTGLFTNTNDPPELLTNALTISEGGAVNFTQANLNATDLDNADTSLLFTITNIQNGTFTVAGDPGSPFGPGDTATFTLQQVLDNQVSFTHDATTNNPPSYDVVVSDGTLDNTNVLPLAINFTPFNDAPTLTITPQTNQIGEGSTIILRDPSDTNYTAATDLLFAGADEESSASPNLLVYTVDAVANGEFRVNGTAQTTFTQQDIIDGNVRFVHDGSENDPTFTVTLSDSASPTPKTVTVTNFMPPFQAANNPPAITVNSFTLTEGALTTLSPTNLSAEDDENAETQLRFSISNISTISGGPDLTFFLDGAPLGTGTFTLADLAFGLVTVRDNLADQTQPTPSFDITVQDTTAPAAGSSETVAASVTLAPVNDSPRIFAPTAPEAPDVIAISENGIFTFNEATAINVLAEDEESGAAALTYRVSNVVAGEFFLATAPTTPITSFTQQQVNNEQVVFKHNGSNNPPSFTLTVEDDAATPGVSQPVVYSTANGRIVFTTVNDPPVAVNDTASISADGINDLSITPLANDSDPDSATLNVTEITIGGTGFGVGALATLASGATVQLQADNTVIYDPTTPAALATFGPLGAGDTFDETFTYTVSDGAATATATITVTVNGINNLPTADPDGPFNVTENVSFTTPNVLTNDTDPDGDTLSISSLNTSGLLGTLTNNGDGTFTYNSGTALDSLRAGQTSPQTFSYTISDGNGGTDTATVSLIVTGVNDAPDAVNDSGTGFTTREDIAFTTTSVLLNDLDPDSGDTFSITGVNTTGTRGLVTNNGNGTFTYNPNGQFESLRQGQTATDSFSYTLTDGSGTTDTATVTITLNGFDRTPATFFDYGQFLRFNNLSAAVPTNEFGGLPIAQFFDEQYYLSQNPDVRNGVNAGFIRSGFDHFVFSGLNEGRNPSILYNEAFYLANNPDVAQLKASGALPSGLVHFLVSGHREGRDPSQFFDQSDYLTNNPDVAGAVRNGFFQSAFEHYIELGADENRLPNLSLYDERYYLQNNPDIANLVRTGGAPNGFTHFVVSGQREGRDPSVVYDEASYLALNSDVAAAVRGGAFISGFQHYALLGRTEGRAVF